jgi:phosphatidylinositol glycan class C protein
MEQAKAWRKALWCPQYYPDNHTDENFLESLVINADVVQRNYKRVVWASFAIDQQVCLTSIVASVAYQLYQGSLPARTVFLWEAGLFLGGASLLTILSKTQDVSLHPSPLLPRLFHQGASTAGLIALTAVLSPVYATLTASISPDTIVASSAALLLAHLYLHDYRKPPPKSQSSSGGGESSADNSVNFPVFYSYSGPSLRGSLGLACAMCSSVLMASQLRQLEDVFALVRFFYFFLARSLACSLKRCIIMFLLYSADGSFIRSLHSRPFCTVHTH